MVQLNRPWSSRLEQVPMVKRQKPSATERTLPMASQMASLPASTTPPAFSPPTSKTLVEPFQISSL